jgi:hypothetical protein
MPMNFKRGYTQGYEFKYSSLWYKKVTDNVTHDIMLVAKRDVVILVQKAWGKFIWREWKQNAENANGGWKVTSMLSDN